MPIYDYACSACGHRTEVIHGINDSGPRFCPECGTEGSMRKALSPPAIVFKGSGWAKVDRRGSSKPAGSPAGPKKEDGASGAATSEAASGGSGTSGSTGSGGATGGGSSGGSSSGSAGDAAAR